ncbi:MAG TPA: beta-agarase [Dyella sp.]|uniref:beta-agarase n=1 Tax=Dyella sp. TaxID=1869338 RepID=UPI002F938222
MRRVALGGLAALVMAACHAAGGSETVDLAGDAPVKLTQVQRAAAVETNAEGGRQRRYTFLPAAAPQLAIEAPATGWNWAGRNELHIAVQNAMGWDVTLNVDVDGVAAGQHLHATVALPAGPAQTLVLPLQSASPRGEGMQFGPPMPIDHGGQRTLLATTVDGQLDLRAVRRVRLSLPAPQAPQTLLLGQVQPVTGNALRDTYTGMVDRWGQYTRGQWQEKIASDDALRKAQADAATRLRQTAPASLDRYGGRLDLPAFKANGWFRSEKRDGRWWLVTPEGHAFFSLGVNAVVADGGRSYIEGRQAMFRDLPVEAGEWAAFYGNADLRQADASSRQGLAFNHGRWFDFYAANLYRLDGAAWMHAWRTRTLARLAGWGFNTLGNWSDDALGKAHRLAYTRAMIVDGVFGNVSSGYDYWGRMPDPYDPRFVQAADRAAAKAAQDVADDPWLLGYFADNELAWAGLGPDGRWGLAIGTLKGEARSQAKQAFVAKLREKYGDPVKLGAAWGIGLTSWDAIAATGFVPPVPNEHYPAIAADYSAWLTDYAATYFRVVRDALRRHDPHHLFLGGRFAVHTPEAVAACAMYCDVISFNAYADVPQHGFDVGMAVRADKPVLIGEFHFGSRDRGPFGAGVVSVYNEQQRGEAYARYIAAAVADPHIVGAHWFEYTDEPVTGRLLDGENMHIGLVGITDIPFGSFVEAAAAANRKAAGR